MSIPMKAIRDDLTGKEHNEESNIGLSISFRNEGVLYKAELDIAPETYMRLFGGVKVPFGKWVKHKTEQEKADHYGKSGHFEPVNNGKSIIASLIEEPATPNTA